MKRGQAATETMVMVGFIVAFSIPIVLLLYGAMNASTDELAISQARVTTKSIADAANEVYAQGPPANRVMLVHYPSGLKRIEVKSGCATCRGGEIVFTLQTGKGDVEVVGATFFPDVWDAVNNKLNDERRDAFATTINEGLHAVNITAVNITSTRMGVEISYVNESS